MVSHDLLPCPFWSKVDRRGPGECWPWQAAKNGKGYGNYRSRSAHVVAYELTHGAVPAGLTIDHLCRNRGCVNPAHLEPVTLQENIRRHAATIQFCKHGHPLSGDNIRIDRRKDGTRRRCLTCSRVNGARRWERTKAKARAAETPK